MRTGLVGCAFAAAVALAVGAAVGWLAARHVGSAAVSSKPPYQDSRERNIGRADSSKGRTRSMNAPNVKDVPRRTAKVNAEKRREQEAVKPVEEPAQDAQAETQKKDDNPL